MSTALAPLPNALAAAHRARTIADSIREQPNHDAALPQLLTAAADVFATEPPQVFDGTTVTNTVPADAMFALWKADEIAAETPSSGLPENFTDYVLAPVFRRPLPFPDAVHARSAQLARQQHVLRDRLTSVHETLNAHPLDTSDRTTHLIRTALALHAGLAHLADVIRLDNTRPCYRR
ncbi:hypothetical protein EV284_6403 [Streptomyces sp. BK022]|uniref:hypothetical protein n=1 Tax=Streptomyces sp. BK022 TaxID=2512123 RepID=UPI0010298C3A|nr:hypothetical protein [Streptomyces sp. BK022]RZU28237.1 hypothetical protein EV284_6403 [Streptomyces sp. BK022]